jgi:signal transduction histidine kinase
VFVFCIICICILIIILIAKSIFKSITFLQEKTELIANGDLSAKIEINKNQSANEITSISENLEKMRLSLLEAQNRKNRFIMGISHDLRTPVAIIKGYTEALSGGIITETQEIKQSLQLINSKTSQLEEMIDTLINYTKLNSSTIRDKMKIQSITDFFTSFIKEISIMGSLYNRKIITNNNLNEEIELLFDEQLINRALENLFSNAIRYTNNNDTITVNLYKQDNSIFFEIIDTGCGMTKDEINNIFDLFYRGTNSRLEKGMGIGLSVVKNIISSHEWNIDVESEKNKGSKFTIIIPLKTNN